AGEADGVARVDDAGHRLQHDRTPQVRDVAVDLVELTRVEHGPRPPLTCRAARNTRPRAPLPPDGPSPRCRHHPSVAAPPARRRGGSGAPAAPRRPGPRPPAGGGPVSPPPRGPTAPGGIDDQGTNGRRSSTRTLPSTRALFHTKATAHGSIPGAHFLLPA